MEKGKKQFVHDCSGCTHFDSKEIKGRKWDLFVCETGEFVGRFGNNGSDYVAADDLEELAKLICR